MTDVIFGRLLIPNSDTVLSRKKLEQREMGIGTLVVSVLCRDVDSFLNPGGLAVV